MVFSEVLANPKEITPQLIRGWELTLTAAGVHPHEIEPTVAKLLEAQTFFPAPADFLKVLRPPVDAATAAELAWQKALQCVRRHGGYASLTAADLGGDRTALWVLERMGWERTCAELEDGNRAIYRAEFIRLYGAGRESGAGISYLVGRNERDNDNRGRELTPILCGRPDWKALPGREAAPALESPVCPECKSRNRHLLWCSALDHIKPLPAGAVEGFAQAGEIVIAEEAA